MTEPSLRNEKSPYLSAAAIGVAVAAVLVSFLFGAFGWALAAISAASGIVMLRRRRIVGVVVVVLSLSAFVVPVTYSLCCAD